MSLKISVKAHPKASKEAVVKKGGAQYEVWVREAPDKGKANIAVLEVLAAYFGVAKSHVVLVSGAASRNKIVRVDGVDSP